MKKTLSLIILSFVLLTAHIGCQSQSVAGVYSGVVLGISPMIGGGMTREDVTYYLRPDKTFTENVDKPDWKTAVDGNWAVQGDEVVLNYNNEKRSNRKLQMVKSGNLQTGGYVLIKMEIANSIPRGFYEFTHASGSGGIGSSVPYVGVSGNKFIYFDGKGNFTQDASSVVAVIGDNIGGGTNKNTNAAGTYTIKSGELTMTFADGKKTTHSIFTSVEKGKTMAFIGGDAYFEKTEEEVKKKIAGKKSKTAAETKTEKEEPANGQEASTTSVSATSLIENLRRKHGDEAIDQVKSMTVTASAQNLALKAVTDFSREWTRLETRQNGKLIMIEQFEGNSGWQWINGKKTSLTAARAKELKAGFSAGLAGLRKTKIASLNAGTVKKEKGGYGLAYTADGTQLGLVTTEDFRLAGELKKTATGYQGVTFDDFREVNGVLFPFIEKHTDGKTTVTIRISSIRINNVTNADFNENFQ